MARQVLEVFLSSTARDLEPFRQAVHARLVRSGQFHCVWQEDFGPHSTTAIEVCRTKVESADLFVGLVGLRRGWEPADDATNRSITEMEYDWATAAGKRRYVWITPDDFLVPGNLRESDAEHARQQAFRTRLMADGRLVVSQKGFGAPELFAADVTEHLLMHELVADLQKRGQVATAERAGLEREIIAKLARQLKPDETLNFERSVKELENAVAVALETIARGKRGTNEDEFVNAVLKRIAEQTKAGEFDRATKEVDAALAELDRREIDQRDALRRSRIALLEAGIEQDILRRDAAAVARRVERIATTENPDDPARRFTTLRRRQDAFDVEGRDKGFNFSLEVAIEIARRTVDYAANAGQRGAVLNDLAISLARLGERESGTGRLEEAVAVFRNALRECTRERAPLAWAATQNNLGDALRTLGERESGTTRLLEAIAAFREALRERSREREPLQWAVTQNNLGNALARLGEREDGTARLEEAVAVYREALRERTRERVPLEWAMTQSNLGVALQTLGEREKATARLEEAVTAYRDALRERTRERVPLEWALTQANLGNALQALGERESGITWLEKSVVAYRAAIEIFRQSSVSYYLEGTQRNLARAEAEIASRRSAGSVRRGSRRSPPAARQRKGRE
jgi:tetratricopeptide (TPR) repeat protein